MKLLVTGGREYDDWPHVRKVLDALHARTPITHVIHGACADRFGNMRGADKLADDWAFENGVQPVRCPALWDFHGRAAGPRRNALMLPLKPDYWVSFPGNKGTADMVTRLKHAGIPGEPA